MITMNNQVVRLVYETRARSINSTLTMMAMMTHAASEPRKIPTSDRAMSTA